MKFFTYILYFLKIQSYVVLYESCVIQKIKTCADCKFLNSNNIKCTKFTDIDLITGEHLNEKASIIRFDENKCGKEGKYFEKNNIKIITVPYYFILDQWKLIIPLTIICIPYIYVLWIGLFYK